MAESGEDRGTRALIILVEPLTAVSTDDHRGPISALPPDWTELAPFDRWTVCVSLCSGSQPHRSPSFSTFVYDVPSSSATTGLISPTGSPYEGVVSRRETGADGPDTSVRRDPPTSSSTRSGGHPTTQPVINQPFALHRFRLSLSRSSNHTPRVNGALYNGLLSPVAITRFSRVGSRIRCTLLHRDRPRSAHARLQ